MKESARGNHMSDMVKDNNVGPKSDASKQTMK